MPGGNSSHSFVIGDPSTLMSFNEGSLHIPYTELVALLKSSAHEEIKDIIKKRLLLSDEETEVVCERLFEEQENGEWEKVPEWAK